MAGEAHDPAHRLHNHVVGRPRGVRPGMAEASNRGVDQARMFVFQRIPDVAQLLHRAAAVVLDQDVCAREQRFKSAAVPIALQIESDGFLVTVNAHEVAGLRRAVFAGDEWPVTARVIALRRLDLDHPRAELRHHQRGIRPRQHAGEIEHQQSGKRATCHASRSSRR